MEYYSAIKRNSDTCYIKWIKLEDIMLGDISQSQKDKYSMTYYEVPKSNSYRQKSSIVASNLLTEAQEWSMEEWRHCLMGSELQFRKMEEVLEMGWWAIVVQQCECTQ